MFKLIRDILLYAGVKKNDYELVQENINKFNRTMIAIFSAIATLLVGAMCIVSFLTRSTAHNQKVYIIGFLASLILFLITILFSEKHSWLVIVLVYISYSIFFIYGITIGAVTNPTQHTVTFMVMLVFIPILFIDRPLRILMAMVFYTAIFMFICLKNKTGDVLFTDIMDAIVFSILGFASGTIINNNKIRKYILEQNLKEAWRFDQLTQMNNRNSFETDLESYPSKCTSKLTCLYVDVNGLHELNNTQGHLKGDQMLQYISEQLINVFGKECSYRIGGDEFVTFAIDKSADELLPSIIDFRKLVEKENYHVAMGFECFKKSELIMDELIKAAEKKMYYNKSSFYQEGGRDRRQNRR